MEAVLFVVGFWRVVKRGYGRLVGSLAAAFALLAWLAGGRDVWALVVAAALSAAGVGVSALGLGTRFPASRVAVEGAAATAGLVAAASLGAGAVEPAWVGVGRALTGAALLGAASDAMILGHWYLIDPRMPKLALVRLNLLAGAALAAETAAVVVLPGTIATAFGGGGGFVALAWALAVVVCAGLLTLAHRALRETGYAPLMSATGLLYLAVMMAFAVVVLPGVAVQS